MKADIRDKLFEALFSCLLWKGSRVELHPLLVFLEEQIAVQQSDGWMKHNPSTKLLQEEDKHLCFLLMLGMAGTNSAVAIGSRKAMLCKAFGLAGRSKEAKSLWNQFNTERIFPFFEDAISASSNDPLTTVATAQKEASCLATPALVVHDKENIALESVRLFTNQQQNQHTTSTPQPNSKKRPPTEGQSPFMSPGSRDMSHRTKHRPAINKNSLGIATSRSAATPYVACSRNVDGLLLAPSVEKSSLQISKQLNGLLLTPSLSVLQKRIDGGTIGNDILLHRVAEKIVSNLADKRTGEVTLNYKDRRDQLRCSKLFLAPQGRQQKKPSQNKTLQRKDYQKSIKIRSFLQSICADDDEATRVVARYVKDYESSHRFVPASAEVSSPKKQLTPSEALCLRDFVGTSTNGLLRFDRAVKALIPGLKLLPANAQKLIAELEQQSVPMECFKVLLSINKSAKRHCLFIRCTSPPMLLERMISSTHIAGKARPSIEISNYRNSNLVFCGLDRGGGDIYMGVRFGNRTGGNQAKYCYPLSVVEYAAEDFDNLKKTFFQLNSPTNDAYQDLLDDSMHSIEVSLATKDGNIEDYRSVAVRLVPTFNPGGAFSHGKTNVVLIAMADKFVQIDQLEFAVRAATRTRAAAVSISTLDVTADSNDVTLSIQMLRTPNDGYVGLSIYHNDEQLVYMHIFERALQKPFAASKLTLHCNIIRGFPSHDGKCSVSISGQSSCSSVRPCLKCIAKKADFRKYRQWMHQHRPQSIAKPVLDEPIRDGEYSNIACYQAYQMQIGDGMYNANDGRQLKDKHIGCSVVNEPCARVDPTKESGGSMHISSGLIDHIIKDTRAGLQAIDTKYGACLQDIIAFKDELEQYIKAPPTTLEAHQLVCDKQFASAVQKARKQMDEAKKSNTGVAAAKQHLDDCLHSRFQHVASSGLGAATKLRKGAAEALEAAALTLQSKKVVGDSEYVFNKAIELTGARFRKEHGGMSISNSHSILVVEHFDKVARAVEECYPKQLLVRRRVQAVMNMFRKLAGPAYKIAVLLKRQDKMTTDLVGQLKDAVCDFGVAFREVFPNRIPYPKLHWLECMEIPYAEKHGFIGLGSEEGFESAHNSLAWIKKLLSAMPFDQDRGKKMGQRYQSSLLPEFDMIWQKLQPDVKKRGEYKKRSTEEKQSKVVARLAATTSTPAPEGLVHLESGNLIYAAWKERYEYVAFQIATAQMKEVLTNNPIFKDQTRQKIQEKVEYLS